MDWLSHPFNQSRTTPMTDTSVNSQWPVEIDEFEYYPIPETWLTHRNAYNRDRRVGPLLFAVSVAEWGKSIRVRYINPINGLVLLGCTNGVASEKEEYWGNVTVTEGQTSQRDITACSLIPQAFISGVGWPRTLHPGQNPPTDIFHPAEKAHLIELWGDKIRFPDREKLLAEVVRGVEAKHQETATDTEMARRAEKHKHDKLSVKND